MVRAWNPVDNSNEGFAAVFSLVRCIFELALMSITSVFLVQHDQHASALATNLSRTMAISCAASFIFSFIGLLSKPPDPDDPGFGPVCLHLLFFGGRTAILVSGLIPTNVLRLIWVQHKRDDNGGVVISMLAVLMVIDALYLLMAIETTALVLCAPFYGCLECCSACFECCYEILLKNLRRRAELNREVAGGLLDGDIEIGRK